MHHAAGGVDGTQAGLLPDRARLTDGAPRLRYLPGLDGLRALAVAAVVLYHADVSWLPGGFLGVDVFLVISGYLITSLVVAEWRKTGRVDLGRFWGRRARRLLPALFALLVVALVVVPLLAPDQVTSLRGDLLAALGYVSNWWQVAADQSYVEHIGRPPPLLHLWSLAVEEQFYLLWPPVLALALSRWGRRPGRLVVGLLLAAGASTALMASLHDPAADPSRVYYGTDTRAAALLVGSALAFAWAPSRLSARTGRGGRWVLDGAGLLALGLLAWAVTRWTAFDAGLYRGGFAVVAVASAVAIAMAVHPGGRVGAALGTAPLRWVGRRSYSIYLWHWPVCVFTRPQLDVPVDGWRLLLLRVAVTLALAEVTHRLVEEPFRRHGLAPLRAAFRGGRVPRLALRVGAASAVAASLGLVAALVVDRPGPQPAETVSLRTDGEPSALAAAPVSENAPLPPPSASTQAPSPPLLPAPPLPPDPGGITVIGDSVVLEAADDLAVRLGDAVVDASVGRHLDDAVQVARDRRQSGHLGQTVVVHLGTNGPFSPEQFDELMGALDGARRVVVVNVKVPRPWEDHVNRVLADAVGRWPNAVLADWHEAAAARPDIFWNDGVHLRLDGVRLFADLIATRLR